jgi:ATP-dependent Clp protease protease subunit
MQTSQRNSWLSLAALCLLAEHAAGFVISTPSSHQGVRPQAARAPPVPRMQQTVDGVRVGPPPDLPSLLLNNRIVYIGMPLAPSVTELVVAELLFLNYDNPEKNVFMYINSPGTSSNDRQVTSFETEAFAISDTMTYIAPEVETICLGTAFGTAAMLLANGQKGKRACLPNSTMMLHQPRSKAKGQASEIRIKAREVLRNRLVINTALSEATGQPIDKVTADSARTKYLNAEQALAYGIVDKVLKSDEDVPLKPSFLSAL